MKLLLASIFVVAFTVALQGEETITESQVAAVVFHETSGLRLKANNAQELSTARLAIAKAAFKRKGGGFPEFEQSAPTPAELTTPSAKEAWEDSQNAAKYAKSAAADNCDHCVIWSSSDHGKSPATEPKMKAYKDWPYTHTGKITQAWGPFSNPVKTGDTPKSDDIYIFIYCGVP